MQEDVPVDSVKPTEARAPVLVPRTRPAPVTAAVVILWTEVGLGLLSGSVMLVAAATVPAAFAERAAAAIAADTTDATAGASTDWVTDIDAISTAVKAILLGAGVITLLLSVVAAALVVPVARGSWSGRLAAYGLGLAAGLAALGNISYTAFGQRVDWAGAVGHGGAAASWVAAAYGQAMPGWLVGAVGGLTDLQVLGYIAVSVLLALPVARPYFRRRAAAQLL